MQKIARRAAVASRQAQRKAKATAKRDRESEWRMNFQEKIACQRSTLDEVKQERLRRKEDWKLGPLAPRRDVGEKNGLFGTVTTARLRAPKVETEKRRKYINVVNGDRVCVIKGKDQGKIGKVLQCDAETETVVVEGLNMYDVEFPSFAFQGDGDKRPYRPYPLPLSLDDVRLVVPLEDPETGSTKDVVVKHVHGGGPFLERPYGTATPKHTRYISGMDIEIPWPEAEAPEFKDEVSDTLRIDVEEKTFLPSLQAYPMPPSVMDELRNKYSKFRTRHDPDYVKYLEEKEAKRQWHESRTLFTPKTELLAQRAEKTTKELEKMKDDSGDYVLSDATVNFIERYMRQQEKSKAEARRKAKAERKEKEMPLTPPSAQ